MDRFVNHDELIESLGAFALDAMDPDEAEVIRRHLEECPRCAEEVSQHQQVAALLGNTGGEAPAHLWEEIAGKISDTRARGPRLIGGEGQQRPSGRGRLAGGARGVVHRPWLLAAAAAVVAIALLSVQAVRLNNRVGSLNALAKSALANPASQKINLDAAGHSDVTDAEVVVQPSGEAYLLNKALPALPSKETYQLWGRSAGRLISLGVLGDRPSTVAFHVGPGVGYRAYVVTAEPAGGVVRTTHPPVASSAGESV